MSPVLKESVRAHARLLALEETPRHRASRVLLVRGVVDDARMADAVERQVMLGVSRVGVIKVDVAGGTVGRVPVEDQAVHVMRSGACELRPQEWHERDDGVLVQLA